MLQRKLFLRAVAATLAALMCVPAVAAESAIAKLNSNQKTRTAIDLRLGSEGSIVGKVVNRQGQTVSSANVKIASKRGTATLKAGSNGLFAAKGLHAGEYVVQVNDQSYAVRMWTADTAPPKTAMAALFVVGDAVRGQCCGDSSCGGGCSTGACGGGGSSCLSGPSYSPVCSSACESGYETSCPGPSCGGCGTCGGGGFGNGYGGGVFGSGTGVFGHGAGLLSSPLLVGAGVAAAIAIPIALDDDDDAS